MGVQCIFICTYIYIHILGGIPYIYIIYIYHIYIQKYILCFQNDWNSSLQQLDCSKNPQTQMLPNNFFPTKIHLPEKKTKTKYGWNVDASIHPWICISPQHPPELMDHFRLGKSNRATPRGTGDCADTLRCRRSGLGIRWRPWKDAFAVGWMFWPPTFLINGKNWQTGVFWGYIIQKVKSANFVGGIAFYNKNVWVLWKHSHLSMPVDLAWLVKDPFSKTHENNIYRCLRGNNTSPKTNDQLKCWVLDNHFFGPFGWLSIVFQSRKPPKGW